MIDLDFFKRINDTHGHAAGDSVLQGIAHLLESRRRTSDVLARYGGEEFCVLLPETNEAGAVEGNRFGLFTESYSSRLAVVVSMLGVVAVPSLRPSLRPSIRAIGRKMAWPQPVSVITTRKSWNGLSGW